MAPVEAEPKIVLVWKQVRHDEKRPEPRPRSASRRPIVKTDAAPAEGGEAKPQQDRRPRRDFKNDNNKRDNSGGENANDRGKPRFDKNRGPKPGGEGRPERGDRKHEGGKPASFQSKPREERPVKFDPDSPFAKLAALRDQMKK